MPMHDQCNNNIMKTITIKAYNMLAMNMHATISGIAGSIMLRRLTIQRFKATPIHAPPIASSARTIPNLSNNAIGNKEGKTRSPRPNANVFF